MDINPFGGETPVNKVLPSDGGLVFDHVVEVFGEFTWVNWGVWPVLETK